MRHRFRTLCTAGILAAVLGLSGCGQGEKPESNSTPEQSSSESQSRDSADNKGGSYRFALIAPLTGNNAQYGLTYKNTLEILIDKVNKDGGINGHEIVLDIYDDKNDPKESVNIAAKLVSDGDLLGVVGSQTSSCCMAAAPLFQEAGIPMVSPQSSHPDFTGIGDYIFRCQVTVAYENKKAAEYLVKGINAKKIAIIYSNDDWGVMMNTTLQEALTELGAEIVAEETYVANQTKDFTPLISKVKLSEPDVLFMASLYSDGAQIIQQCRNLELNVPFVGSNTFFKQEFIDVGGDSVEGVTMTNTIMLNNNNPEYLWLEKAYTEKTGAFIDTYVTQSYDSLSILLKAVKEAGTDRRAIRDNLAKLTDYEGVSGTFSLDENRDPEKEVFIYQIKDGKIIQLDETY